MVEADYYMKKLVDGSDTLNVDGFKSLTDMALDVIREDIIKGQSRLIADEPNEQIRILSRGEHPL